jgi:transglycosylase-like protein with SLT domain
MSVDTSSATASAGVDPSRVRIASAIKQAASTNGTSFEYLLTTAKMESDFNPTAGAKTSSAHGLFQFIDQTWLGTVKEAGAQFGYGHFADAITKSSDGSYSVNDPSARQAILKLRDDPAAASSMAAVLTQSNSFKLTGVIGRRPTDGELYIAHFLGVGGAAKLIANVEDNPHASAAQLFPNAAAANRSIFYDHFGRARSVAGVYAVLTQRYASAAASSVTRNVLASVGGINPPVVLASALPAAPAIETRPDSRTAAAFAIAPASGATNATATDPIFRSLFQSGDRTEPVSPAVQRLWGKGSSLTADVPASSAGAAASASSAPSPSPTSGGRLDLFSDRSGAFSG